MVRLVGTDGTQGVVTLAVARASAQTAELDLVEVAPEEVPPVCKLLDYGKVRFLERQANKSRKDAQPKLKELRVSLKIGAHDLDNKVRQARELLEKGHRVAFGMQFKARENQYPAEGLAILQGIAERLQDVSRVERAPYKEGKRAGLLLTPVRKS